MKYSTPPDAQALFETLKSIKGIGGGSGQSDSDIKTVLSGLIRGLISPAHAQGFYTAFVTILKMEGGNLRAAEVIKIIDTTLTDASPSSGATKREKTLLARARALALGGLVRSGKLNQVEELNSVLKELVSYCERKESLSVLVIPFILQLLELIQLKSTTAKGESLSLVPIEGLLMAKKIKNSSQLQISLKANNLKIDLKSDYLESMDNIIDTLLMYVQPDDTNTLQSIIKYLESANKLQDFWTALAVRLKRIHLSLLVACIRAAIQQQCTGSHFLSREIIVFLLKTFLKSDLEGCQKAKEGFGLLLNWASDKEADADTETTTTSKSDISVVLSRKERKKILKDLFEGVPNVLHEYKFLKSHLQHLISSLSAKEIDEVMKYVESDQSGAAGDRLRITSQHFRALIAASKNASLSCKLKIMQDMFKTGFCRKHEDAPEESADAQGELELEKVVTYAKTTFTNLLGLALDEEVVSQLFAMVLEIVTGDDKEWGLANPVGAEIRKLWKRVAKLTKDSNNVTGGVGQNCLKLHLILDLIQSKPGSINANDGIETLMEICEGVPSDEQEEDEGPNHRLAEFMLNKVLHEDNVILDYEPMLKNLFQDQDIIARNLGAVTEVVDPEDDDEDMDEDDDEEEDGESSGEEDGSDSDEGEELSFAKKPQKIKKEKLAKINGHDSGSDSELSSLDMDEATEEDLERMNSALANVFSAKKNIKNASQLELARFMRACKVLDLVIKTVRVPNGTLVPLILPPCISCLVKSSKKLVAVGKKQEIALEKFTRIRKLVGRLVRVRKVLEPESVEEEILQGMLEDIEKYCKGKLRKEVRIVLVAAITMLKRCFKIGEEPKTKKEPTKSKKRKHKHNRKQDTPAAATPGKKAKGTSPPASTPKKADKNKKRRQSAPAPGQGLPKANGNGIAHRGAEGATPAKKKRKSTVT